MSVLTSALRQTHPSRMLYLLASRNFSQSALPASKMSVLTSALRQTHPSRMLYLLASRYFSQSALPASKMSVLTSALRQTHPSRMLYLLASRYFSQSALPASMVLDTNVVVYALNGELWGRSHSTLIKHRRELKALLEAGVHLEMLPAEDEELRRSVAVHTWIRDFAVKYGYTFMITPTVEMEIFEADQVSWR